MDDGPGHDSDISESELEADHKGLESRIPPAPHERLPFPAVDLKQCRQHRISKIVHLKFGEDTLYCGISVTANLIEPTFDESRVLEQTFCEQCHKAMLT